jgi:hypothetical protein
VLDNEVLLLESRLHRPHTQPCQVGGAGGGDRAAACRKLSCVFHMGLHPQQRPRVLLTAWLDAVSCTGAPSPKAPQRRPVRHQGHCRRLQLHQHQQGRPLAGGCVQQ